MAHVNFYALAMVIGLFGSAAWAAGFDCRGVEQGREEFEKDFLVELKSANMIGTGLCSARRAENKVLIPASP